MPDAETGTAVVEVLFGVPSPGSSGRADLPTECPRLDPPVEVPPRQAKIAGRVGWRGGEGEFFGGSVNVVFLHRVWTVGCACVGGENSRRRGKRSIWRKGW